MMMKTQEAAVTFQGHDSSQDLVRTDRLVGGLSPISAKEESFRRGETHHPVGDDIVSAPVQDNVSSPDLRRFDGLHGYEIAVQDGGLHAHAVGAEADALPILQKLRAQVDKGLVGVHT